SVHPCSQLIRTQAPVGLPPGSPAFLCEFDRWPRFARPSPLFFILFPLPAPGYRMAMPVSYISPLPPGRLPGAVPFAADALYNTVEELVAPRNAAGVHAFDMGEVVCLPGGRVAARIRDEDLFICGPCLTEGMKLQSTAGKPNLLQVMQEARLAAAAAGKSDDVVLRQTQRAMA
ncbi:unnamed protein product, partial [Ectocarpus sp. 4 AP-2014]